jgi:hypothetical protein
MNEPRGPSWVTGIALVLIVMLLILCAVLGLQYAARNMSATSGTGGHVPEHVQRLAGGQPHQGTSRHVVVGPIILPSGAGR